MCEGIYNDTKSSIKNLNQYSVPLILSSAVVLLAIAILGQMGQFPLSPLACKCVAYAGLAAGGLAFILFGLKRCLNSSSVL